MNWGIPLLGGVLFFTLLLWYVWTRRLLRRRSGLDRGESLSRFHLGKEGIRLHLAGLAGRVEPRMMSLLSGAIARSIDIPSPKEFVIDRDFRITYGRELYINQTFDLLVRIGAEGKPLSAIPAEEAKGIVETESERLKFEAREEEPEVEVGLKFAEGDFSANRTVVKQMLAKDQETRFKFMLKPLKAEDCILTVTASYISTVPEPDQILEKVTIDKVVTPAEGAKTKEHVEQATLAPATVAELVEEVKTVDLRISVNSLFGMNASEVSILQKVLGPVAAVLLLVIASATGKLQSGDFVWYAVVAIANAAGIPIIDALAGPLEKPEEESGGEV